MTTVQRFEDIRPFHDGSCDGAADENGKFEYNEGKRFLAQGEFSQAAVAFHNALVASEEAEDVQGIANALHQLGKVCRARGDREQALQHFLHAEKLCSGVKDTMSMTVLSLQMIELLVSMERYDEALQRCFVLLELYQRNNDPQGCVKILDEMSDIYVHAGEFENAADALRTIASIHRNFNHETMAETYLAQAERTAVMKAEDGKA